MRKTKLILSFLLISNTIYSQSKSEQIIDLNLEIDSLKKQNQFILNQVFELNSTFLKSQEKLNTEIEKNELTINQLNVSIFEMQLKNDSLKMLLIANKKKVSRDGTYSYEINLPDYDCSGKIIIKDQSNNSFKFSIYVELVLYGEEIFIGDVEGIANFRSETSNIAEYLGDDCDPLYFLFNDNSIEIMQLEFECYTSGGKILFDRGALYVKEKEQF